jgi:hypothetical protein
MKTLQTVTAVVEAGAGLALLGVPSATASLLFGTPLETSAALGLARDWRNRDLGAGHVCWLARRDVDGRASRGLVAAMTFYNVAVAAVLAFASFGDGLYGALLWPAVAFHIAMAACASPACKKWKEQSYDSRMTQAKQTGLLPLDKPKLLDARFQGCRLHAEQFGSRIRPTNAPTATL